MDVREQPGKHVALAALCHENLNMFERTIVPKDLQLVNTGFYVFVWLCTTSQIESRAVMVKNLYHNQ